MSYFNTTQETKHQVDIFTEINKKQDEVIKDIVSHYKGTFTPRRIWKLCPSTYELTSVRRALDTLKKDSFIIETGSKLMGDKGRSELELIKL